MFFQFVDGSVKLISKRLDGRYDWLTSPYNVKEKRSQIVAIGDGCEKSPGTKYTNKVVLISNDGKCTYFEKVKEWFLNSAVLIPYERSF